MAIQKDWTIQPDVDEAMSCFGGDGESGRELGDRSVLRVAEGSLISASPCASFRLYAGSENSSKTGGGGGLSERMNRYMWKSLNKHGPAEIKKPKKKAIDIPSKDVEGLEYLAGGAPFVFKKKKSDAR